VKLLLASLLFGSAIALHASPNVDSENAASEQNSAQTTTNIDYVFVAVYAPVIGQAGVEQLIVKQFEDQNRDHENIKIQPVVYYTSDVLTAVMDGFAHIGISREKWSDKEVAMLENRYKEAPLALTISANAHGLIKNDDNDVLSLPLPTVKALFSDDPSRCEAKARVDWRELGASTFVEGADSLISVYPHGQQSVEGKRFARLATCGGALVGANEIDDTQTQAGYADGLASALSKVVNDPRGLTYDVYKADHKKRYIAIEDTQGEAVPVREDTVFSGQYPLGNVYYAHIAPFALDNPSVKQYIEYMLSDKTQNALQKNGFLALPEPIMHRNRVALSQEMPIYSDGYR
jgi:ABC-type phosphate transport system substrate-binding protein